MYSPACGVDVHASQDPCTLHTHEYSSFILYLIFINPVSCQICPLPSVFLTLSPLSCSHFTLAGSRPRSLRDTSPSPVFPIIMWCVGGQACGSAVQQEGFIHRNTPLREVQQLPGFCELNTLQQENTSETGTADQ